ncbi:LysR family transcriptional regulator [Nocardioides sp. WV_118_6]
MELRHLHHFVAVAEARSFTEAARRLGVVQSSVSLGVQALERELEVELFERTSRRVALTPAGAALLPHAYAAQDALTAGGDAVRALHEGLAGTVEIGSTGAADPATLARSLAAFRRRHPGVVVRLRVLGSAAATCDALRSRTVDLALLPIVEPLPPDVEIVPLETGTMVAVLPADDELATRSRLTLRHLRDRDFVDAPAGSAARTVVDRAFQQAELTRTVTIEAADTTAVLGCVGAGLGVAIVPRSAVGVVPPGVVVKDLRPGVHWAAGIALMRGRHLSAAGSALLDELRATSGEHPA